MNTLKTTSDCNSYSELVEEFIIKDIVTGRKLCHILNQKQLNNKQMDQVFNDWIYEGFNDGGEV